MHVNAAFPYFSVLGRMNSILKIKSVKCFFFYFDFLSDSIPCVGKTEVRLNFKYIFCLSVQLLQMRLNYTPARGRVWFKTDQTL